LKNFKVGIFGIIGILVLVVFASGCTSSNTNSSSTNGQSSQSVSTNSAATWHSIANFTGTGNKNTPSFKTQGNKFKVKMKATATSQKYANMNFFVYPEGETKGFVGYGDFGDFNQTTVSDEFEVTASPGNYYINVIAANLKNWNIEVFDYY
jgi:uncharacterized protein (UPF0333 family)